MDDEEKAKKQNSYRLGQDLAELSIDEISDMMKILQDEIERLDAARASKSDHLSAANALFKS